MHLDSFRKVIYTYKNNICHIFSFTAPLSDIHVGANTTSDRYLILDIIVSKSVQ